MLSLILATQGRENLAEKEDCRTEGMVPDYVSAINRLGFKLQ